MLAPPQQDQLQYENNLMNSGNLWNNISMFLPTKHYSVEKDRWMKGHEPIIAHSRMCLQLACCCFSPSLCHFELFVLHTHGYVAFVCKQPSWCWLRMLTTLTTVAFLKVAIFIFNNFVLICAKMITAHAQSNRYALFADEDSTQIKVEINKCRHIY